MAKQFKKIKTLVLSGGGTRCISFIGAVKALQELKMYNHSNVTTFAGTSGGSLIAMMMIAGYTPDEMWKRILEIDFKHLQHLSFRKILILYGLDSGYGFINEIEKILEDKGFSKRITMKKFYELTRKDFYITTTCVNRFKPVYIHHSTFPDITVAHALRMSMSIPFIFTSVKYKNDFFVDGGVLDNYPIALFNNEDKHLMGLNLNQYKDEQDINIEIKNIQGYAFALMNAINYELQTLKRKDYIQRTIEICTKGEYSFDMTLTPEKIKELIETGYKTIMEYFNLTVAPVKHANPISSEQVSETETHASQHEYASMEEDENSHQNVD